MDGDEHMKFLGVTISDEEEKILTDIIIDSMDSFDRHNQMTDEDVLHMLIQRSQYYNKVKSAERQLRKLKHYSKTSEEDKLSIEREKAYDEPLNILCQ